jgi:cell division initiation protein
MTPQEIQTKEFREAFRGYNQDDVDVFLDELADEHGRLLQESQRLRVQTAALQQEIARLREATGADPDAATVVDLPRITAGAEDVKGHAKAALLAAQTTAEGVLQEARAKADQIIAEAERRAREIDERSSKRAEDLDPVMASTIEDLQASINELRRRENEIRERIRTMLEEHLKLVDQHEAQAHHAATVERIAEALGDSARTPQPDPRRFWTEPVAPPGDAVNG